MYGRKQINTKHLWKEIRNRTDQYKIVNSGGEGESPPEEGRGNLHSAEVIESIRPVQIHESL